MSKKAKHDLIKWIISIVFPIMIVIGMRIMIQPTMVRGQSMYPTLQSEDYLLINKAIYKIEEPQRGDIVVFKTNLIDEKTKKYKKLIKRIIAKPGEHIIIENNKVYIDGKNIYESYINGIETPGDIDMVIPNNHVFIMGDNRCISKDSRSGEIGVVSIDNLVGRVSIRAYPFNRLGIIQ